MEKLIKGKTALSSKRDTMTLTDLIKKISKKRVTTAIAIAAASPAAGLALYSRLRGEDALLLAYTTVAVGIANLVHSVQTENSKQDAIVLLSAGYAISAATHHQYNQIELALVDLAAAITAPIAASLCFKDKKETKYDTH